MFSTLVFSRMMLTQRIIGRYSWQHSRAGLSSPHERQRTTPGSTLYIYASMLTLVTL